MDAFLLPQLQCASKITQFDCCRPRYERNGYMNRFMKILMVHAPEGLYELISGQLFPPQQQHSKKICPVQ